MESGRVWPQGFTDGKKLESPNQILEHLQARADEQGKLDWEVHYVDGTVIRAHQHASGGKKGAQKRRN